MSLRNIRWYLAASWVSLVLLAFIAADAPSGRTMLALAVIGFVPPLVMLALLRQPPTTIAEVLYSAEHRR